MINLWTDYRSNERICIHIMEQNEKKINFKASNGWRLQTLCNPEIDSYTKTFYLQGTDKTLNNKKMLVSKKTLDEIVNAVYEYNETCISKSKSKAKKESKKEFYVAMTEDGTVINDNDFNSLDEAIKMIEDNKYLLKILVYKKVAEVEPIETVEYKITKF